MSVIAADIMYCNKLLFLHSEIMYILKFPDMVVGSSSSVNVKIDDDSKTPSIFGAEFLPDGRLILCDCMPENRRIKLLSSNFSMLDSLQLQSEPIDVSSVNSTTIIITLPYSKLFQYVYLVPHFKLSSQIQLDTICVGVDAVGGEIFTSCFNSRGSYGGEVRVFDLGGTLKRRIGVQHDNSYMFRYPFFLTVSSNSGYIYVSDYGTDKVTCLSSIGRVIFQYTDPELRWPRGVYVDPAGNTIVCGNGSDNVHVISANGTKHKILLTSSDDIYNPLSVAYRQSDATLVIGSSNNNNVLVYKLDN